MSRQNKQRNKKIARAMGKGVHHAMPAPRPGRYLIAAAPKKQPRRQPKRKPREVEDDAGF